MRRSILLGTLGLSLLASGCGDDSGTGGGGGGGGPPQAGPRIDIVVDADRNGVADLESAADQESEESFEGAVGAVFLPNFDDDDGDEYRDCDDVTVASNGDDLDLAKFKLAPCDLCADDVKGELTIDAESSKNVRIFWRNPETQEWQLVLGETNWCMDEAPECTPVATLPLDAGTVKAGAEFAIEARDFMRSKDVGWIGVVDLNYKVTDAAGEPLTSDENPEGSDRAFLRLAPWILNGNLSPFDKVWSSDESTEFVDGVQESADAAEVTYETYGNYGDQWTQDWMQTGYFAMPIQGEGGEVVVHGMGVANARPWGRNNSDNQLPLRWLMRNYLGPNKGVFHAYKEPHTGDTYDSHGNHDLIPAYTNGDQSFPLGRIIIGSGVLKETRDFYNAQGAQSPYYTSNSSWLLVGHVDEYFSYAPAATERGWKLLVAAPVRARGMFDDLSADGGGALIVHQNKDFYDFQSGNLVPADSSVDELLANEDVMDASQTAQVFVDEEIQKLADEVGLADDEIVEMPFLYGAINAGYKAHVAYQPGTVNLLLMGDVAAIPKPFGPRVNGEDIFETDLNQRLGTSAEKLGKDGQGLVNVYVDNWDLYHRLDGEVHCGTNPETSAPFSSVNWWETGK
jgi:protein-arginine deiminase